jgi:hypothetical protein
MSLSEEPLDTARRIALVLHEAERSLGVKHDLPLDLRLNHILAGAMERPTKVTPAAYAIAYKLSGAAQ